MVFNDTRVVKARLFARRPTGGRVELLLEREVTADEAVFQLRASHPPRPGGTLLLPGDAQATVIERDGRFFRLRLDGTGPLLDYLERHGDVPLPPYIGRAADATDAARYQTVYARHPGRRRGADGRLALRRRDAGGPGGRAASRPLTSRSTSAPGRSSRSRPRISPRIGCMPSATAFRRRPLAAIEAARARGGRIVAIGTTSLRALESAADDSGRVHAGEGETRLFITPGYRFRVVERLLTNFHLPKSTLLMLVSAFAGVDEIRAAYAHAIANRYRFFSYGDAMLLERATDAR